MNALSILDIYYRLKAGEIKDFTPTAFIFGAKASPGYARAKAIIKQMFQNKYQQQAQKHQVLVT